MSQDEKVKCFECRNNQPLEWQYGMCGITGRIHAHDDPPRMCEHFADPHYLKPFLPGERVVYCGAIATVMKDYGHCGEVQFSDGARMTWYCDFNGERVARV